MACALLSGTVAEKANANMSMLLPLMMMGGLGGNSNSSGGMNPLMLMLLMGGMGGNSGTNNSSMNPLMLMMMMGGMGGKKVSNTNNHALIKGMQNTDLEALATVLNNDMESIQGTLESMKMFSLLSMMNQPTTTVIGTGYNQPQQQQVPQQQYQQAPQQQYQQPQYQQAPQQQYQQPQYQQPTTGYTSAPTTNSSSSTAVLRR